MAVFHDPLATSEPIDEVSFGDRIPGGRGLPTRIVMHGLGGVGKTSWAAFSPNPLFILSPGETGLHVLLEAGQVPERANLEIHAWENFLKVLQQIRVEEHDYKTLVIDCLDGIEMLGKRFALRTQFKGDAGPKGFMSYAAGDRYVAEVLWPQMLTAFDRLRSERKMGIIGLAHSVKSKYENPAGPDYDRFVPDLYKDTWAATFAWADIVLYAHFHTHAEQGEGDRKGKAFGQDRYMNVVYTPIADAKNRHGLVEPIPMGESGQEAWSNLVEARTEARKPKS